MPFPPEFLDELRNRISVSEVVGRRVKLIRKGREFGACCPFHNEKTPSFTVNDQKGFFHCFGCGAHGSAIDFIMRQENRSFPEAVEVLAGLAGMQVPQSTPEETQRFEKEKNLYTLIEDAAKWFEEQLHKPAGAGALKYARSRGLTDEIISRFRLGFAPNDGQALLSHLSGKGYTPQQMQESGLAKKAENEDRMYSFFRGRLIFPVGDRRGRVVAFGARLLEGEGPKYINSAEHSLFHKGTLLYGFSRARAAAADNKPLIITEGYMDVIRLVDAGFAGAVAPLGTALTEEQMLALWRIILKPPTRPELLNHIPILCFDGDTAGQRAAERALLRILPHLAADQSARFAAMPEGEDPDSLIKGKGPAAMQAVLDRALPLIDFLWQATAGERPLNTPEDRAGFRRDLEARISEIRDTPVQRDYREAIFKRLQENFGPVQGSYQYQPGRMIKPSALKPRALPSNLQERIVLAILINHPVLFPEMEEALHALPINDKNLVTLLQSIFEYMGETSHAHDDAAALRAYLEKAGFAPVLEQGFGPELYMHAKFARPDRPLAMARAGWHEIWNRHLRAQLEEELKTASFEEKNSENTQIQERIRHLRAMLAEMDAKTEAEAAQA
ncbi:MAG: DNA primase [Proteobacteria bacterium]|nr:DNA primase [Pseudomonadota bacterium]